ncbi:MAG: hypothetical protein PHT07_17590 [Paludibacter sp.]|nr:hypothetical protein [Paludibacter sp.]
MAKLHFFLKLNPPRASFTIDMTNDEKLVMLQHVSYWKPYVEQGIALVLGPVFDPKGGYGIAVVGVDNEEQLETLIKNDPANGLNKYEIYPMRASSKFI